MANQNLNVFVPNNKVFHFILKTGTTQEVRLYYFKKETKIKCILFTQDTPGRGIVNRENV